MKTVSINNKARANGKRAYAMPRVNVIKMGASYGVMDNRSIPIDEQTPATGDGNAKRFELEDNMWDDNFDGKR